jgi:hypothetical protein
LSWRRDRFRKPDADFSPALSADFSRQELSDAMTFHEQAAVAVEIGPTRFQPAEAGLNGYPPKSGSNSMILQT